MQGPPPTPTPLVRDMSNVVDMPAVSLWDSADEAISFWNVLPEATTTFQIILIIAIVVLFIMFFTSSAKRMATRDESID